MLLREEERKLASFNAVPTAKSAPIENAIMENPSVMTSVIRIVSITLMIALNCFVFFYKPLTNLGFIKQVFLDFY